MIRPEPQRVAPLSLPPALAQGVHCGWLRMLRVPLAALPRLDPGDLIWLREAILIPARQDRPDRLVVHYRSDSARVVIPWPRAIVRPGPGLRDPDHMPREVSRATLVVEGWRSLRLQDVDDAEALMMGVRPHPGGGWMNTAVDSMIAHAFGTPREAYLAMWHLIHEPVAPWTDNPEVAEIRFTPMSRNVDRLVPGLGSGGVR